MSYQAIARKWRPQNFEEIAGQSHVTRTLTNALKKGRIHHAFLFTGPRGVGKTTAARAMARSLNCELGITPKPCGICASCIEIAKGHSPDVTEVDGASNNSVDDVRLIRDSVQYLPSKGKYRVYIIDEVHMLSKPAFNALLKTLEEPPAHVVFIFATTEPQRIPETVLSRVQRFDFKRIPVTVVAERLGLICEAEKVSFSQSALRMIARAGEGSMRDAQSLLDQVIAFAGETADDDEVAQILGLVDRSLLYQMLEGLLQAKPDESLEAIATVYEHGYELSQFTAELLELVRNAALASLSPSSKAFLDITEDERKRLLDLSKGVSADVFSRYFDVLMEVHDTVSKSARPRLVLEMAVARLSTTRSVQPVDVLLSRLEGLERRIRNAGATPSPPVVHQSQDAQVQAKSDERGMERNERPQIAENDLPQSSMATPSMATPSVATPSRAARAPTRTDSVPSSEPELQAEAEPEPEPEELQSEAVSQSEPRPVETPLREASANDQQIVNTPVPVLDDVSPEQPILAAVAVEEPTLSVAPVLKDDSEDSPPLDTAMEDAGSQAEENSVEASSPIPIVSPMATQQERYGAFVEHLRGHGVEYRTITEHSVLLDYEKGVMEMGFTSERTLKRGGQLTGNVDLLRYGQIFFPDLKRIHVRMRPDNSGTLTAKEATDQWRKERDQSLWDETKADPAIQELCTRLDGTIESVTALEE